MDPIETRQRKLLHDYGPFLKVEEHEVAFPGGPVIPDWTWVVTPNFINVAAVTAESQFILFRQTKYAVQGASLAPVGGYLDGDEDPLAAAQRELQEETGYASEHWQALGAFPVDANRGVATAHFFLASDCYAVAKGASDDLEQQELQLLEEDAVREALAQGEFKAMPWVACMHLALAALNAAQ